MGGVCFCHDYSFLESEIFDQCDCDADGAKADA